MLDKYLEFIESCFSDVPTNLLVGFLFVFTVGAILLLSLLGWKKGVKWTSRLLLIEYLLLILVLSVLIRSIKRVGSFNFTPFWSYRAIQAGDQLLLIQAIMNVVAFIPVGVLLGFSFAKIRWWKVLLIGGGFSVMIETLQFVFRRGFAEFDDVFHNVLGCLIGYGLFSGIAWLVRRFAPRPEASEKV